MGHGGVADCRLVLLSVDSKSQRTQPHLHDPTHINGILPKGPYLPCLHMADRALLAGYPQYVHLSHS